MPYPPVDATPVPDAAGAPEPAAGDTDAGEPGAIGVLLPAGAAAAGVFCTGELARTALEPAAAGVPAAGVAAADPGVTVTVETTVTGLHDGQVGQAAEVSGEAGDAGVVSTGELGVVADSTGAEYTGAEETSTGELGVEAVSVAVVDSTDTTGVVETETTGVPLT